jgi:hypothetical protein
LLDEIAATAWTAAMDHVHRLDLRPPQATRRRVESSASLMLRAIVLAKKISMLLMEAGVSYNR